MKLPISRIACEQQETRASGTVTQTAQKFWGQKFLILGEQQYFVWDAASQSTKRLDMLKISGRHGPLGPFMVGTIFPRGALWFFPGDQFYQLWNWEKKQFSTKIVIK